MSEGQSPWLYVGLGCLLAVILVVGSCVAIGFVGMRKAKELGEEIADPVKREARVLEVLGADELPPGYYPMMAMSMPLGVMEMAMLTDEPPRADAEGRSVPGELGGSGLIWVSQRDFGNGRAELSAYLQGEGQSRGPLENLQTDVDFENREVLARGQIAMAGVAVLYASYEGSVDSRGHAGRDAVTTLFQPLCPDESRVQTGIWWVPADARLDDEPGVERETVPAEEAEEPAKPVPPTPEELADFLSYFELCG